MAQPIGEDVTDVVVGEAVVDHPPALGPRHHVAVAKQPQLMAQRRLADPEQNGEVADAELLVGQAQGVNDAGARGIGQDAEGGGHAISTGVVKDATEQRRDVLGMDALHLAPLRGENI